jgi:CheY-like chemotaxis protein
MQTQSQQCQVQQCKSILIVEDNDDIRETLEEVLRMEGYRVYAVSNGRDALAALKRVDGPSLILLDMMMPVMNGWEFLEVQKSDHVLATLPVVVVSALGAAAALACKKDPVPAVGYIKKPIALNPLMEIVQQYCGMGDEKIAREAMTEGELPTAS